MLESKWKITRTSYLILTLMKAGERDEVMKMAAGNLFGSSCRVVIKEDVSYDVMQLKS